MVLWATLLVIHGVAIAGSMPAVGPPENITVMFLSPYEVRVSWTTGVDKVEKYDVTYKPTEARSAGNSFKAGNYTQFYRVVVVVAGNADSVTLNGLKANTQYQVTVTAVRQGKKYRSRPIVFQTLDGPRAPNNVTERFNITGGPPSKIPRSRIPPYPETPYYIQTVNQVRGIEIGIVCLVLLAWVGAIILFFNRWGKIRMLLPYQPDYKDTQLKVPGTCQGGATTCQGGGSSGFCCSQRHLARMPDDWLGSSRRLLACTRSRTNSAVLIDRGGRSEQSEPLFTNGFMIGGSKSKSADQLPGKLVPIIDLKCFSRERLN